MKRFKALALACLVAPHLFGTIIPADRRITWTPGTNVGVPGGIPTNRTAGKNVVTDYGADPTGVADSRLAFASAITNTSSGQYVVIPAGTYKITGNLTPKSGVTLRGAGRGVTILKPDGGTGNGHISNTGDYPDHTPTITVLTGATKGSTSVTVDTTTGMAVGRLFTISDLNTPDVHFDSTLYGAGPGDDGHDSTRLLNSTHYITGISGSTVTFTPALYMNMTTPKITPWTAILNGFGIEDLTIDSVNSTLASPIYISQGYGCWFKNIELAHTISRQLWTKKTILSQVEHCYFHDTVGTGPNHEGLDLIQNVCGWLIWNNIFIAAGKPTVILGDWGGGCCGNVIAYNYMVPSTNTGAVEACISFNHGPENRMNLAEGNFVVGSIKSDGYYGSSSYNTIANNVVQGDFVAGVDWPNAIQLCKWSYYYNVVGNILGKSGASQLYQSDGTSYASTIKVIWDLNYPNTGNKSFSGTYTGTPTTPGLTAVDQIDQAVESSLIRHGNYDYNTNSIVWDGTIADHSLPSSYIFSSKPAWWGELPWPAFDPANPGAAAYTNIPAGYFYVNGFDPPPNPAVVSATINSAGTSLAVVLTPSCTTGAGGNGGLTVTLNGNSTTPTYSSGSGSTTYNFALNPAVPAGYTATLGYTQPGNGIESTSGGVDLTSFSGQAVTNNSTAAPLAPSSLTATAAAAFLVNLSWTDNSGGVATFSIERSFDGSSGWTVVGAPAAGATTYADNGLAAATRYYYRIRTLSGGVYSSYSSTANDITPGSKPYATSARNVTTLDGGR